MSGLAMIELFDKAAKELKWPKLVYKMPNGEDLVFKRAAEHSKNPGCVYVFRNGVYQGKINRAGNFVASYGCIVVDKIAGILENPINAAKINGQQYNICCFCSRELTHPDSVTAGYGPICADKWGLPWEGLAREVEKEVNSIEDLEI